MLTNDTQLEEPRPTEGAFPWLDHIPVDRICLEFQVVRALKPGPFPANRVRGSVGHYLRGLELCAAIPNLDCNTCHLPPKCSWFALFGEPPLTPCRPYALSLEPPTLPRLLEPGERLAVHLTLFGPMAQQPERLVAAFYHPRAGGALFGGEARLEAVQRVSADGALEPYRVGEVRVLPLSRLVNPERATRLAGAEAWHISLVTPLSARLHHQGLVREGDLSFVELVQLAVRRTLELAQSFGSFNTPISFGVLAEAATRVKTLRSALQFVDLKRTSHRQNADMAMGGLVGQLEVQGPVSQYAPLLLAAEICHLGKRATFGFGQISINPLEDILVS